MINNKYPTCAAFKKNELDTLAFISSHASLNIFPELQRDIETAYARYKKRDFKNEDFSFRSLFGCDVEKKQKNVLIGANIKGNYEIASYLLAICREGDTDRDVIRKFHFDYANPANETKKQPVPVFHLQYGGQFPDDFKTEFKLMDDHIESWLSLPRLSFTPLNLALMLDILLCEFYSVETNKIIEDPHWRGLIKKNEEFLTHEYYKSVAHHINSSKYSKDQLIRDLLYGK